ncbi:MAG: hypothetical protein EOT05_02030 [Candidatus Microsaccharimonas sossegonensis]|uniref:Uncharacterized protein n=1 Tax=Candidatus Microsaccharimonas sossegonensis TaxID=2506948 RepID=A0A4Q0AHR1_9BACT|nr:MAG: hypothetical protein EOT05_02030 [Candidatus Microsaccharimonas sossegonensis]
MNRSTRDRRISELRPLLTKEPITRAIRPATIEFVKLIGDDIRKLSLEERLIGEGTALVGKILSVLVLQSNETAGVNTDGWFNPYDEPVLERILELTSALDLDANQPEIWSDLSKAIDDLK